MLNAIDLVVPEFVLVERNIESISKIGFTKVGTGLELRNLLILAKKSFPHVCVIGRVDCCEDVWNQDFNFRVARYLNEAGFNHVHSLFLLAEKLWRTIYPNANTALLLQLPLPETVDVEVINSNGMLVLFFIKAFVCLECTEKMFVFHDLKKQQMEVWDLGSLDLFISERLHPVIKH